MTRWEFDPAFVLAAVLASWAYAAAVASVNAAHPLSRYPGRRVVCFYAGMGVLVLAIMSPVAYYAATLFSVHMWQHMLIVMVAAPLLLLGTPVTLALRAASPSLRRSVLLPVLHSRALRAITFPVVAWVFFTATMWVSHFSPLFNAALENAWLHRLEHGWYLSAALLFWWQVIGLDPTPWRMNHPVRMLYLFLQMPQNSLLGTAVYNASGVLYTHYAATGRTWGPSPLFDQEVAGITMWVIGDLLFLLALGIVAYGWVQHEERRSRIDDAARARAKKAAQSAERPRRAAG